MDVPLKRVACVIAEGSTDSRHASADEEAEGPEPQRKRRKQSRVDAFSEAQIEDIGSFAPVSFRMACQEFSEESFS